MMSPDYELARAEARRVLNDFGVTEPPIDPEEIAESMGVNVIFVSFDHEISKKISGFIDFDDQDDSLARIVVNKNMSPKRMNFTIAHELGHFLMHQEYARGNEYQILPRSNHHASDKPKEEKEADLFAAELIAPKQLLLRYKKIASLPELSSIFVASEEMLKWRIHNLERFGN